MKTKAQLQAEIARDHSAVLIVNTFSRHGEQMFFRSLDGLIARNLNITASYPVRHPRQMPEVAQEALARNPSLVIIGGGDGTISSLMDYFAYRDVVVGLLPLGTGNSFVRGLGIPLELGAAMDVIANGKVVDVDLGKVNDNYFSNMVAIGFSADVAHDMPHKLKRVFGPLAYGLQAIKHILKAQKFHMTLTFDGETYTADSYQVLIANGSGFGLAPITPGAHVADQQLTVLALKAINRWELLDFWGRSILGKHRQMKHIKHFTTQQLTIQTIPPRTLDIDGEQGVQTPVTITLAPEALKVMAPQSFQEP
ncbi:MAG: YegS/Rv2252/BmrU family lipid kinase [Anaerolineales bacterium]|jgi:diacylglycerol kinase (ATP)|nr:YegS/Rv2252/BmrU family lipid kinase [Anaerolineales bacterium]